MQHKRVQGFALIIAIFLLGIMSFIAYGLVKILIRQQNSSIDSYSQAQAYYTAYSALERQAYSAIHEAEVIDSMNNEGDFYISFLPYTTHAHLENGQNITIYELVAVASNFDPNGATWMGDLKNPVRRELSTTVFKVN